MIAVHVISMVAVTIASIIKGFMFLFNRHETYKKFDAISSKPSKILAITGIAAGVYIVITKFGGIVPMWLIFKLGFLIAGGTLFGMAEKRGNKIMLAAAMILLFLVIVQANVKFS